MTVVSVPEFLLDGVGAVDGAEISGWDVDTDPSDELRQRVEVVVVPPQRSPWLKRLDELPALRAVVLCSAGYDHAVRFLPDGVQLANAVGVHDTATAEIALTLILAAQREVPAMVLAQRDGQWGAASVKRSLADARVLVIGYGGIGRALTRRLLAGEAQVTAVASRAREGDDLVDRVHGIDELADLLPSHQVVALAVPAADSTHHLLGGEQLAALPDDALVVNVGRGSSIDTYALIAECATGRLRAALDVTDPEPLPAGHPLWATPGVLISPHTGGGTVAFLPRIATYLRQQITHFTEHGSLDHVVAVGGQEPS